MNKVPKVVIVGRVNVGKSMLFNRLSTTVKSLTLDYEGVTRDFITDIVSWQKSTFELIDSGGIELGKPSPDILIQKIQHLVEELIQQADLILFVVDAKAGLTNEDQKINDLLFKLKKKVLIVVNKIDSSSDQDALYDFYRLGREPLYPISAIHGTGIGDLLEAIADELKKEKQTSAKVAQEKPKYGVVLLGKPNVGKSSLMNLLLERERSIVTDQPGTTREAITEPIHFYKETIVLTDTPGIRKKRSVKEQLEEMMVKSAFRAAKYTDIVLLLVDGSEGKISDQELKLAFYVFQEQHKALIILINKDDLMDEQSHAQLDHVMEEYEFLMNKIPLLYISCKSGRNIGKIMPLIDKVWQRYSYQFSDAELTSLLKNALQNRPLYHQTQLLTIKNAKQIKTAPITIVLFVNEPKFFGPSQLAFFENVLRKQVNLMGAPLKWIIRKG